MERERLGMSLLLLFLPKTADSEPGVGDIAAQLEPVSTFAPAAAVSTLEPATTVHTFAPATTVRTFNA
jgi:hypothetical protein